MSATGIRPSRTAHDRFQEWVEAGVFLGLWAAGLTAYDGIDGIDRARPSMDGAMSKSPSGGGKVGTLPDGPGEEGRGAVGPDRGVRRPGRAGGRRGEPARHEAGPGDDREHSGRPAPTADAPHDGCTDEGYDYDEVGATPAEFGFTARVESRREEVEAKRTAGSEARRWAVERTHRWMNRSRRLLVRWEKKPAN